jgi:RNA polymerase sigma-70 factor (ECF subfamily)
MHSVEADRSVTNVFACEPDAGPFSAFCCNVFLLRGAKLLPLQRVRGKSLQFQSFDESYVERLRAGDFRTQEHFVAYFSELIQLKLRSRLHSPQAIEDVRQETFVRIFAALRSERSIRQPDRLGAFVNSTCNNVLLEYYRASSRHSSLEDEEQEDFPATTVDIIGAVAAKQMQEKVREILEELPERDRRLLREIFLEEKDKDEVCRDFGVDRDYLRVLLHRAKLSFKSLYLKHMEERPPGVAAAGKI